MKSKFLLTFDAPLNQNHVNMWCVCMDPAKNKSNTGYLFAEHNILKFHDLVKHNELAFMHKYVNNMLPSSFNDKFVKLASFERSLSFQMEVVKKSFLKTLPTYSLPKNWNSLLLELKRITSLNVFKNRNKETILITYNFSCTVSNSCQSWFCDS